MTTPPLLRAAVARDLAPARPLLPPSRRALLLAPLALATVVAIPSLYFFRPDLAELGVMRAWGLSFAEAAVGLSIVGLGLREAVPGRALSGRLAAFAVATGLVLPLAIYAASARRFDVGVPPEAQLFAVYICYRTSAAAAIPALIAAAVLAARAFPLRPALAGALYGVGCGVIADAGLRLFCDFTMPSHVVTAHGGAVATVMLAGVVVARITPRP